jgi:hypothetical protein
MLMRLASHSYCLELQHAIRVADAIDEEQSTMKLVEQCAQNQHSREWSLLPATMIALIDKS